MESLESWRRSLKEVNGVTSLLQVAGLRSGGLPLTGGDTAG